MSFKWAGKLRLYDINGNQYEEFCQGNSMGHAAHIALRGVKHQYVRAETMDGTKLAGQPRPHGFSLGDVATKLPNGFRKADPARAVVGEEIASRFKEELLKLEGVKPTPEVKLPPPPPKKKMTQKDMLLSIASKLPDPFRIEDVSDRLAVAGFGDLAKNLPGIRTLVSTAIYTHGIIDRVSGLKGVYKFKVKPAPAPKKQSVTIVVPMKESKVETPPAAKIAAAPSIDSLVMAAAVSFCLRPEDREAMQDALAKQRAALEASLKVAEILDRMLRLEATRDKFAEALRMLKHESEA